MPCSSSHLVAELGVKHIQILAATIRRFLGNPQDFLMFPCGASENNPLEMKGGCGLVWEGTGLGRRRPFLPGSAGES